jgi:hypothetical protein
VVAIHPAAFLRDVVAGEAFREARLSTRFLENFFPRWSPGDQALEDLLVAAAMVANGALGSARPASPSSSSSGSSSPGNSGSRGPHDHVKRSPWAELTGFEPWSSGER